MKDSRTKYLIIGGILVLFVVLLILGGKGKDDDEMGLFGKKEEYLTGLHHAEIDIKNYGVISVELDGDAAPISVTNFINLAKSGYYDGSSFHRIIKGFMMQGGIGKTSAKTIKGEFSENGIKNDIKHERGVISMARAGDKNSASSQFFIMHKDNASLDGKYAAFGHVTSGMEIVDKICEEANPINNNGIIAEDERPIINTIRIID